MDSQLSVTRKRALRGVFALLALLVLTNFIAFTQRRGFGRERFGGALRVEGPTFGGGFISPEGPPPVNSWRPNFADGDRRPNAPQVHWNGQRVGHDFSRDRRFQLDLPWEDGGFTGGLGPRYVFRLEGCDSTRFRFRGYAFRVAPFESDWCAPGSGVKTTFDYTDHDHNLL